MIRSTGESNSKYQLTHDFWISGIHSWIESLATTSVRLSSLVNMRKQKFLWERHELPRHLLSISELLDVSLSHAAFRKGSEYRDFAMKSLKFRLPRFLVFTSVAALLVGSLWGFWRHERTRRAQEWISHAESVPAEYLPALIAAARPNRLVADLAKQKLDSGDSNNSLSLKVLAAANDEVLYDELYSKFSDAPVSYTHLTLPTKA